MNQRCSKGIVRNEENSIMTIYEFLTLLRGSRVIKEEYIDNISNEYIGVLAVTLNEFKALSNYLKDPKVSTQHGVKGESHNTVTPIYSLDILSIYSSFITLEPLNKVKNSYIELSF